MNIDPWTHFIPEATNRIIAIYPLVTQREYPLFIYRVKYKMEVQRDKIV